MMRFARAAAAWLRSRHPLQRLAMILWAGLILGVGGRVAFGPPRSHTVVPIYLTAAERWANREHIYEPAPPLDVYRNPPGIAAAFVPLTWTPERAAEILWRGIGVAALLMGLGVWLRHGLSRPLTAGESGAIFALVALIAIPSLNNGQTNLLIIGALLLGFAAATRGRDATAGTWFALAAAVKVYPLAVGLLASAARPRRVLAPLGCAALGFSLLPFFFEDSSYVAAEYRRFCASVNADDRTFAPLERASQDAFLALRVWLAAPPPRLYLAFKLAVAAGMAGLVVLAARRTRDDRAVNLLAFHLGCCWITVLGPATEVHTYVLLAPTAAWAVVTAFAERHSQRGKLVLALSSVGYAFLVLPILRDAFPNGKWLHALALPPIGGMLVLGAVLVLARRTLTEVEPSEETIIRRARIALPGMRRRRSPSRTPQSST